MTAPQSPSFSPCFKISITNYWFFTMTFIYFYVHFKRYKNQGVFVSLCSSIIIPKICNILSQLAPMMIFTPIRVIILEKTHIKSFNAVWVTFHMWEFQKSDQKIMLFELHDFLIAHVCNFSRLALQESLR